MNFLLLILVNLIKAVITTELKIDDEVQNRLQPSLVIFDEIYVPRNPLSLVFIQRDGQPLTEPYAIFDAFSKQPVFNFQWSNQDKSKANILTTTDGEPVGYSESPSLGNQFFFCSSIVDKSCPGIFRRPAPAIPLLFRLVVVGNVYNKELEEWARIIVINRVVGDIRVYMRSPGVRGRILLAKLKGIKVSGEFNTTKSLAINYQISVRPGVDAAFITLLAIKFSQLAKV